MRASLWKYYRRSRIAKYYRYWRNYCRAVVTWYRYEGLLVTLWRSLVRGLSDFASVEMQLVTFLRSDLTQPLVEAQPAADISIAPATESDIDLLVKLLAMYRHGNNPTSDQIHICRQETLERLQRGQVPFIGKVGEEIAHFNWIVFDWLEWPFGPAQRVFLRQDEANTEYAYTAPRWRGRSIHTAVLARMLHFLKQQGYRVAYTQTGTANRSSLKAHRRLRWEVCGIVLCIRRRGAAHMWVLHIKGNPEPFDLPRRVLPFMLRLH